MDNPAYLTRGDLIHMKITAADLFPGGVAYVSFSHSWYGPVFVVKLKFHLYINREDRWFAEMTIYPRDYVMISRWIEKFLERDLISLFGPLMRNRTRGRRWTY